MLCFLMVLVMSTGIGFMHLNLMSPIFTWTCKFSIHMFGCIIFSFVLKKDSEFFQRRARYLFNLVSFVTATHSSRFLLTEAHELLNGPSCLYNTSYQQSMSKYYSLPFIFAF